MDVFNLINAINDIRSDAQREIGWWLPICCATVLIHFGLAIEVVLSFAASGTRSANALNGLHAYTSRRTVAKSAWARLTYAAIFYNPIHRRWNALFRLQLKIISFPSVMWVNSYAQRILTIHRFVCVYFVRWHATDMTEDSLGSSVSCLCDLMCERRRNKNEWMEEREKKTTPNGSVALRHSDCHTRAYIMRLYPY